MIEHIAGDRAFVIRSVLSPEECAAWIEKCEQLGFGPAPIQTIFGERMKPKVRNNTRLIIDDFKVAADLYARVAPSLAHLDSHGFNERLRFYRYERGQFFAPHLDGAYTRPDGSERSIYSVLIYLNDDFDGGATRLLQHFHNVRPEAGMALFFTHRQLHSGAEVTSGRKYVLRTDLMFN